MLARGLQQVVAGLGAGGRVDDPGGAVAGLHAGGDGVDGGDDDPRLLDADPAVGEGLSGGGVEVVLERAAEPGEACGFGVGVAAAAGPPLVGVPCTRGVPEPSLVGLGCCAAHCRVRLLDARVSSSSTRTTSASPSPVSESPPTSVSVAWTRASTAATSGDAAGSVPGARHSTTCPPSCPPSGPLPWGSSTGRALTALPLPHPRWGASTTTVVGQCRQVRTARYWPQGRTRARSLEHPRRYGKPPTTASRRPQVDMDRERSVKSMLRGPAQRRGCRSIRGEATHGDCCTVEAGHRRELVGNLTSRQTETYTLRTGPSDFCREPIVPGWI